MNNIKSTLFFLSMLLVMPTYTYASCGKKGGGEGRNHGQIIEKLELTEKQRATFKAMHDKKSKQNEALRAEKKELKEDLKKLKSEKWAAFTKGSSDKELKKVSKKIVDLKRKMFGVREAMQESKNKLMVGMKTLLTQRQRDMYADYKSQGHKKGMSCCKKGKGKSGGSCGGKKGKGKSGGSCGGKKGEDKSGGSCGGK